MTSNYTLLVEKPKVKNDHIFFATFSFIISPSKGHNPHLSKPDTQYGFVNASSIKRLKRPGISIFLMVFRLILEKYFEIVFFQTVFAELLENVGLFNTD